MPRSNRSTHSTLWPSLAVLAATAMLLALFGCGSDEKKNPLDPGGGVTPSTSFTGSLTSGTVSGTLGITVSSTSLARGIRGAAATVVTASGTLKIVGGGTISLTGSYDTVLDTLYLAGGGYLIRGTYYPSDVPPTFNGTWVGPGGSGFWGCIVGDASTVKVFCGTFSATSGGYGKLNMVVYADTAVVGLAQSFDSDIPLFFDGTVSRNETSPGIKTITLGGIDDLGAVMTATGELTVATNMATGTWEIMMDTTPVDDGTWEAQLTP